MFDPMLPLVEVTDKSKLSMGSNVSYGIAPILNTLVNTTKAFNKPRWDLYLINAETIIRDRKEEAKINEGYVRSVIYDMQMLSQYIAAYNRIVHSGMVQQQNPLICFYFPHYNVIPKIYLRDKFPKGTEDRWKLRDAAITLITKEGVPTNYENTDVIYTMVGKKSWPHKELFEDLCKQINGIPFRNCLMVSHVPSDFHLYKSIREFTVLESYTGALKMPKQLGKKVFKDENIPFNKYTHLLLGDKWYLKNLIPTAVRNKIKERAIKEHWTLIPDKAILSSIVSMKLLLPEILTKPDI